MRALEAEVPRARAVLLERQVPQVRAVADEQLDHTVREVVGVGRTEPVEHGRFGALAEHDEGVRERRLVVALAPMEHHDRLFDDDAVGDVYERATGEERVVQHREGVLGVGRRATQ